MTKHPRVDVADVLRGIAVMGIILLHSIEHFNFYSYPDTAGQSEWLDFSDKAIWDACSSSSAKSIRRFRIALRFQLFHPIRQPAAARKRLQGTVLLAALPASPFRQPERLVLYGGGIGALLFSGLHPSAHLPPERQMAAGTGLRPAYPTPTLYYAIRAACDPAFVTPAVPTGHLWAQTFAVQQGGTFLGNRTREPLGGTTG